MFQGERFTRAFEMYQRNEPVTDLNNDKYAVPLWGYAELVCKEWNQRLGKSFWVGPDISIDSDLLIPARTSMPIDTAVELSQLMPFSEYHPYALTIVTPNTRSRFAQLGLTIWDTGNLARTIYESGEENGKPLYRAQLVVTNHAARPIFLPKGSPFFNTYYHGGGLLLFDDKLKAEVGKTILVHPDEEGKTWWWHEVEQEGKHVVGIEFAIAKDNRRWIPPAKEPMTLSASPTQNHNRAGVDEYLVPIPQTPESIYWIGETAGSLGLTPEVHGIMSTLVPGPDAFEGPFTFQTNSVLIKGGNTDGPMRTEIWSATTPDVIPKSTVVHFIKA